MSLKEKISISDWNPVTREQALKGSPFDTYRAAKTLAERAVWELAEKHPDLDITTCKSIFKFIRQILTRFQLESQPAIPVWPLCIRLLPTRTQLRSALDQSLHLPFIGSRRLFPYLAQLHRRA